MVGRQAGVAAKLRAEIEMVNPGSSFAHFHCIIHQQYLCSKILKMENIISLVTKTVNYIRGHPLNHRQFSKLLTDINNQFSNADESLQMELLEIQSDSILKAKYLEVGIPAFFSYLPGKFKNFKKFATKIIAMFNST
ncbi:general transcription factor II-I repeat domain-containing protein 2-like [Octopus sinensis]|uniref:General transcription factor II-I repeat domain-containing protein 2-like n=1 Tax=Octopus sinensis TaxID=2607531 RepID=A0A6P7TZG3_9MOLL|nr:general transcription factor II-I repeat domain-containing protein 2-like [Octopus sinensis]